MKVIIAGGRDATMRDTLEGIRQARLKGFFEGAIPNEVVCGEARGADTHGRNWAEELGIEVKSFPANWDKHGRRAGPLRNIEMGDYADALIAIWDGESKGTKHMIDYATKVGIKVYVHRYVK